MAFSKKLRRTIAVGLAVGGITIASGVRVTNSISQYRQYNRIEAQMKRLNYPFENTGVRTIINHMYYSGGIKGLKDNFRKKIKGQTSSQIITGISQMKVDISKLQGLIKDFESGKHRGLPDGEFTLRELKKIHGVYESMLEDVQAELNRKPENQKKPINQQQNRVERASLMKKK